MFIFFELNYSNVMFFGICQWVFLIFVMKIKSGFYNFKGFDNEV